MSRFVKDIQQKTIAKQHLDVRKETDIFLRHTFYLEDYVLE